MQFSQFVSQLRRPLRLTLGTVVLGAVVLGTAWVVPSVQLPVSAQQINNLQAPLAPFQRLPQLEPTPSSLLTNARQTYPIRLTLPADAGTSLTSVQIRQPNPEQALDFDLNQTAAFQGTTRLGESIPIQSVVSIEPNQIQINFAQPVEPGASVTILLKPRHIPTGSNRYPLIVSVPTGANSSSDLGQQQIETCRSRYDGQGDQRVLFWDLPPEFNPRLQNRPCQP